jgi:hypothetical protein
MGLHFALSMPGAVVRNEYIASAGWAKAAGVSIWIGLAKGHPLPTLDTDPAIAARAEKLALVGEEPA